MKTQPRLSLCMIIRDEAEFLPGFIEAHRDFFDEWIVVDTGSSDASTEILKAAGITPLNTPWENDFSKARNYALTHAQGRWIASFDADEIMAEADQVRIKELISPKAGIDAVSVVLRNYSDDIYDMLWESCADDPPALQPMHRGMPGYIPVPLIRFFRNRKEYSWEYPIHELIQPSIERAGGKIQVTNLIIHHYGFSRTSQQRDRKGRMYHQIAAGLKEGTIPSSPKILCELARVTEDPEESVSLLSKARALSPDHPVVMAFLGDAQLSAGRMEEALNTAEQLIALDPQRPGGYLLAAKCYFQQPDPSEGVDLLRSCLPRFKDNPNIVYSLAMLLFISGDLKSALFFLKRANKLAPQAEAIEKDLKRVEDLMSRYKTDVK